VSLDFAWRHLPSHRPGASCLFLQFFGDDLFAAVYWLEPVLVLLT
jgi:hypothetical protein